MNYKGIKGAVDYLKQYKKGAILGGIASHLSVPFLQTFFSPNYNPEIKNVLEHAYSHFVEVPVNIMQKDPLLIVAYLMPLFLGSILSVYVNHVVKKELENIETNKITNTSSIGNPLETKVTP